LKPNKQPERVELLVVDDELLIRDLLFDFFTAQGYTTHLAENGKTALEMMDSISFQTALVDLKMPFVDGIELTTLMAKKMPQVPVIVMTAFPSMDSAIEAIRCGVYDYIVKPFNITELHETVKRAIEEYKERIKNGYRSISSVS
jgi:DNA-binding NtrC family response regulator